MKIIGISGKKQSGKNSSANYINGIVLKKKNVILDFNVTGKGELNVLTNFEDGSRGWGVVDLYRRDAAFVEAAENRIFPYVKNYSFADSLKDLAISLFGLNPENVYGTDEQKKEKTHLLWENMPGVTTEKTPQDPIDEVVAGRLGAYYEKVLSGTIYHEPGFMTSREFLQFFGTEIGRKMYPPIWVNATINKIMSEQSGLAIITDVRFPDEVAAIKKAGGYVIRLGRTMFDDYHPSETALDKTNYEWKNFDEVMDNQNLSLLDSCKRVEDFARSYNLI